MKKLFILILIILISGSFSFSQGYWTQKQDFGGMQRCSGIGLATTFKGYVIGGYLGGYDHFKDCWEYSPTNDTWLQRADFPGAKRRWLMGFVLHNKLYVGLGAFMNGPSDYTYYSDFYEFNPDSNVWHQKASFPGISRVSAFCFEENGKGYVGGGLAGASTALNDLWCYDPISDTWTQKNNISCSARWAAVSFTASEVAFIGLGYNGSSYLNDLWQYNPYSDSWLQKANFPGLARWYGSAFSIANYGYMGTGADGSGFFNTYWQYNVSANTWLQIPDLTGSVRCEPITFTIANKAYVGTGLTDWTSYTNDFWEYTPSWYGISENENDLPEISLYPNPTSSNLNISFSNFKNVISEISVYDISGKLILQKKVLANQKYISIDCASFARGKYFVRVFGKEKSATKTFIKL
jgi:N-acetylneuraminic acid mutarotase